NGQWPEVPTPFDHFQDGGMIVEATRDGPAPRPGRNYQGGHAEAAAAIAMEGRIGGWNRSQRRGHMVEKPAPLVKVDHENCIGPVRTGNNGFIHAVQEGFAVANVRVRMIIVG